MAHEPTPDSSTANRAADIPTAQSVRTAAQDAIARTTLPLQRSLENVLASPQGSISSATELARAFEIEQTLAWRIWRLVHATSSEETASFVIGSAALETFLAAASRRSVPDSLLDAVRQAHKQYRTFVDHFAGDDATLRMMLAPLRDDKSGAALAESQILFDAHRLRVGVQAASQLRLCILYPVPGKDIASAAMVEALTDLWWLRPTSRAVMGTAHLIQTLPDQRGAGVPHRSEPLDPLLARKQQETNDLVRIPLLPEFCSGDSTHIESNQVGSSEVFSIRPQAVGRSHASTLCMGRIVHESFRPLSQDPETTFSKFTFVPSEVLVMDLYVAADLVDKGFVFRPAVTDALFWPNVGSLWAPRLDLTALGGTFQTIEPTKAIDNPTKMARYRELVEWTFQRLGLEREGYFCFRLRVPMPPMGCMFNLRAGLDSSEPAR